MSVGGWPSFEKCRRSHRRRERGAFYRPPRDSTAKTTRPTSPKITFGSGRDLNE